jgi:hypothetical protein
MENGILHADHIDETGAYARRFQVVKELVDNGTLTQIPEEFRVGATALSQQEVVPVTQENSKFSFYDEFGQKHADHVDETGEYRKAWESMFGPMNGDNNVSSEDTPANTEWKSFLQQLIAEEKAKLNI